MTANPQGPDNLPFAHNGRQSSQGMGPQENNYQHLTSLPAPPRRAS